MDYRQGSPVRRMSVRCIRLGVSFFGVEIDIGIGIDFLESIDWGGLPSRNNRLKGGRHKPFRIQVSFYFLSIPIPISI
ncbi:MAG: hypothetical protein JW882_14520, partial [Deltaproteobacteria bacterium]|nr:hypothetical protein [Deltaproteobacteria bacterium]